MRYTHKTSYPSSETVLKSLPGGFSQTPTPQGSTKNEEASTSDKSYAQTTSLVKIEWVDASSHGGPGWVDLDEGKEFAREDLPVMSTVGFVLHEKTGPRGWISVTDTIGGEECSTIHKIQLTMILHKEYIYHE